MNYINYIKSKFLFTFYQIHLNFCIFYKKKLGFEISKQTFSLIIMSTFKQTFSIIMNTFKQTFSPIRALLHFIIKFLFLTL